MLKQKVPQRNGPHGHFFQGTLGVQKGKVKKSSVSMMRGICLVMGILILSGCSAKHDQQATFRDMITPTDATIIEHHVGVYLLDLRKFVERLYARNPVYERDINKRQQKIDSIFQADSASLIPQNLGDLSSRKLLTAAFATETKGDRIYLLGLGLTRSIEETYELNNKKVFLTGLQIPLERLERLHFNLSQVNWRLKTYRDESANLLFLTNGMAENGYLNMGYEVLMTRILTRIEDDIFLRGGLPNKYMFRMSTIFLSILM